MDFKTPPQYKRPQVPVAQPRQTITQTTPVQSSKNTAKYVFITIIAVLLLSSLALGYFYKTTNDALRAKSTELSDAHKANESLQKNLDQIELANRFKAAYNDEQLSRRSCGGNALGMFDIHINSKYATYKYLCADTSMPVLIQAWQKNSDGKWSFTYGSSTNEPTYLPSYIYDTDPNTYKNIYGARRF